MPTTEVPTFSVGQTCTYTQLIDDKLTQGFADLTGDHNPIHLGNSFAKEAAHCSILFGIIFKVLGMEMPGVGTEYIGQHVTFRAPISAGDTVTLVATITELLPDSVAKIDVVIKKQTGEVVVDGYAEVKLPG